jgi:hypothetical protein
MSSNTGQRRIPLTRHIPFHRTTTVRQWIFTLPYRIDTNLTAESRSFPYMLANMAQFVSFVFEYYSYLLGCNRKFVFN